MPLNEQGSMSFHLVVFYDIHIFMLDPGMDPSSKKNQRRQEQKSLTFISLLYSTYFIVLNLVFENQW